MPTESSRQLAQAVEFVALDMRLILRFRRILLPEPLQPMGKDVWPTIERRISELRAELLEAPDSIDLQLEPAGLTGLELDVKLAAHRQASERAHAAATPPQPPEPPRGFRRIFRSLLGWINVWLGSLVAAIGSGEAIKEFKEYLEQGVDDAENLD